MAEHPIEGLMTTAMQSIKEMVDVNTIVGDAVQSPDGTVIIPVSRVSFGFASGGGEYSKSEQDDNLDEQGNVSMKSSKFPFAGGSGAGVSIVPVAFMVVGHNQTRLLPVNASSTSVDRLLELVPEIVQRLNDMTKKKVTVKKEEKTGDVVKTTVKETVSSKNEEE